MGAGADTGTPAPAGRDADAVRAEKVRAAYASMASPPPFPLATTAQARIAAAVCGVIGDLACGGRPRKMVSRNTIESLSLTREPTLTEYNPRFRRKCVTLAICAAGYRIKSDLRYDIVFVWGGRFAKH